jgi:DeoR/GlpR family transcriptional regulator of sugar metabolism
VAWWSPAAMIAVDDKAVDRYARWNALVELLAQHGEVTVDEAADRLQVSPATIRRDFEQLAQQELITRTRGGAVTSGVSYDLPLPYKTGRQSAEKRRIGAAAAALVEPGMVVGLNGGTTTTEVARALAGRPELAGGPDSPQLTVVTNALGIANELLIRSRMKIVVAGGVVRPQSYELVGPLGSALLDAVTMDLVLLGRPSRGRGGDEQPDGRPGQAGRDRHRRVQTGPARVRPGLPDRPGRHARHRQRRRPTYRRRLRSRRRPGYYCLVVLLICSLGGRFGLNGRIVEGFWGPKQLRAPPLAAKRKNLVTLWR